MTTKAKSDDIVHASEDHCPPGMREIACPVCGFKKMASIGEIPQGEFEVAFFCGKCNKYRWVNERNIDKLLVV